MNSMHRNLSFVFVAILVHMLFASVIGGSSEKGDVDSSLSCYENKDSIERKCIISNQKMVDNYKAEGVTYVRQKNAALCISGMVGIQMWCNVCQLKYTDNSEILCEKPVCICRKNAKTELYEVRELTDEYAAQQVSCGDSLTEENKRNPNYHLRLPRKVCTDAIKNNQHTGNNWYRVNTECKNLQ